MRSLLYRHFEYETAFPGQGDIPLYKLVEKSIDERVEKFKEGLTTDQYNKYSTKSEHIEAQKFIAFASGDDTISLINRDESDIFVGIVR
jgi:hypothetical protein